MVYSLGCPSFLLGSRSDCFELWTTNFESHSLLGGVCDLKHRGTAATDTQVLPKRDPRAHLRDLVQGKTVHLDIDDVYTYDFEGTGSRLVCVVYLEVRARNVIVLRLYEVRKKSSIDL